MKALMIIAFFGDATNDILFYTQAEHIMMKTTGSKTTVKIIDFGLAVVHNPGDPPLTAFAGSACTVAPEVIQRQYGKEIDLWSIG